MIRGLASALALTFVASIGGGLASLACVGDGSPSLRQPPGISRDGGAAATDTAASTSDVPDLPQVDVGSAPLDAPPTDAPPAEDAPPTKADAGHSDVEDGCMGDPPDCAHGCGSDWFAMAECGQGLWACPPDTVRVSSCPDSTCWGPPHPGEICDEGTWTCRPDDDDLVSCPELLCPHCTGFDEVIEQDGCRCRCTGEGMVACERFDPGCTVEATSSLPGVSIRLVTESCTWTLEEAKTLQIEYELVIDSDVSDVIPLPQDAGSCDQPGPGGLSVFERLSGGGQSFCICDTGLCAGPNRVPVTLRAGTFAQTFRWDGRNWFGPSDFGNPKGDPFPSGTYLLSLSARGEYTTAAGEQREFDVRAEVDVELVP